MIQFEIGDWVEIIPEKAGTHYAEMVTQGPWRVASVCYDNRSDKYGIVTIRNAKGVEDKLYHFRLKLVVEDEGLKEELEKVKLDLQIALNDRQILIDENARLKKNVTNLEAGYKIVVDRLNEALKENETKAQENKKLNTMLGVLEATLEKENEAEGLLVSEEMIGVKCVDAVTGAGPMIPVPYPKTNKHGQIPVYTGHLCGAGNQQFEWKWASTLKPITEPKGFNWKAIGVISYVLFLLSMAGNGWLIASLYF